MYRLDDGAMLSVVHVPEGIYVTLDDDVIAGPIDESLARIRVAVPLAERGQLGVHLTYDGHIDLDLNRTTLMPVGNRHRRAARERAAVGVRPTKRKRVGAPRFFRPGRLVLGLVIAAIAGVIGNIGTSEPRELAAGDCFGDMDTSSSFGRTRVSDVRKQPCDEPHEAEVFAIIVTDGDGPSPTSTEGESVITSLCDNALASMITAGTIEIERYPLDTSFGWIALATRDSADGDREIICFLESESLLPGS